ncbi:MAG: hypothetical protein LBU09_02360 [Endomicrobium sp.]|jgi:hypothetical protein|nr:hypothetical protein [Endomicrobium sp.]
MRKVLTSAVALLLLTAVAAVNSAYALGVDNSTKTATVSIPDALGLFQWNIELKKVADNSAATQITWETTGANAVQIGSTDKWYDSNVYAVITSTLTKSKAKIEIYQDNANSTVYKATDTIINPALDKTFNGLVLSTTSAGSTAGVPADLPFAWRVSTNTKVATDLQSVFPPLYTGQYFTDKSDTHYATDADKIAYRTVFSNKGVRYGGGANEMGGSPSGTFYMYFGANFEKAMGGMTYGSDRIVIRGFEE